MVIDRERGNVEKQREKQSPNGHRERRKTIERNKRIINKVIHSPIDLPKKKIRFDQSITEQNWIATLSHCIA